MEKYDRFVANKDVTVESHNISKMKFHASLNSFAFRSQLPNVFFSIPFPPPLRPRFHPLSSRRCRAPIVSWLELCCLASRSDSRHVITRWLDDREIRRETETKREERERSTGKGRRRANDRYGMHEVRFLRDCRGEGTRKTYVVSVIPEERSGRTPFTAFVCQ